MVIAFQSRSPARLSILRTIGLFNDDISYLIAKEHNAEYIKLYPYDTATYSWKHVDELP